MLDVSTDAVMKARIDVSFVFVVDPPWRFRFTSNLKSRNLLRQLNQLPILMRSKESLPCCWIFITRSSPQRSRLLKENWAEIACINRFFMPSVVVLTVITIQVMLFNMQTLHVFIESLLWSEIPLEFVKDKLHIYGMNSSSVSWAINRGH